MIVERLIAHARKFPHDVEGCVIPHLRTMERPHEVADAVVAENVHLAYLLLPFLSPRWREWVLRSARPIPVRRTALVVPNHT
jgi:hypothetical protein